MPERSRVAGILAIVLALIAYAYSPLLAAGFLGEDLALLASLDHLSWSSEPSAWYAVEFTHGRPGAALLMLASRELWTADAVWSGAESLVLRLENLALLLIAAWGLMGLLRRAAEPWAGPEVARAAGHAAAGCVLLHPLLVSSVARLSAGGDLLALALAAWSGFAFLIGRQERRRHMVTVAWCLAVLAGLCSPLALFLPLALAGLEYHSARRLRPRLVRVRTSTTTLLVFTAAVLIEAIGRAYLAPAGLRGLGAGFPRAAPELWLERLGVLLMPGNVRGWGPSAPLLAGMASLVALHPALVAARSAPRLWGRMILAWAFALAVTVAPTAATRITQDGLAGAHLMLPAVVVMAIGLGTCSTALSGWRRTFVPIAVGGLFAILGRSIAVPHAQAAQAVASLREDLIVAARGRAWSGTLAVVDPPLEVAGLDPLEGHIQALLSPALAPGERARGMRVFGLGFRAFEVWSRDPTFAALRETGLSVLLDRAELGESGPGRVTVALLALGEERESATWVGEGRSTAGMVFDPLLARHLTVTALPDASADQSPVVRWTADVSPDPGAEVSGVWLEGDSAPVAVFDLERQPTWLLGGRIRSVWLAGELTSITAARITPGPRPLAARSRPEGADWIFDGHGTDLPRALHGELEWRLGLLDLDRLRYIEFAPRQEAEGRLRFERAESWASARREAGSAVVWCLDLALDGVTLARASGRVPIEPDSQQ
jgi:hypothetical protein